MSSPAPQSNASDAEKNRKVVAWVEKNVGGTVERCEPEPRWGDGWWVNVRRDGKLFQIYVREERNADWLSAKTSG